jgi:hypothetical protein
MFSAKDVCFRPTKQSKIDLDPLVPRKSRLKKTQPIKFCIGDEKDFAVFEKLLPTPDLAQAVR